MKDYHRVQANINLDAICQNIDENRRIMHPDTKLMAVVKADAYGHGAVPIAKWLEDRVDAYGVAILEEAVELRRAGVTKPVLILGFTPVELFDQVVKYDISQAVFRYDMAEKLAHEGIRQGKKAKVHIKVDTGMGRIGFTPNEESYKTICEISQLNGLEIEGIFTHFATADETDKTATRSQIEQFASFVSRLEEKFAIPIKHMSNSAGIIDIPDANMDMVRMGISLYGLYPSNEVNKEQVTLAPAMELVSNIVYLKEVEAGVPISYGGTFVTTRKTKVATIPVGYGDGYPRALSSKGRVLIHGQSAPILGRVCMDQFMVDVTDIEGAQEGDTVTLIGKDQNECITVEEIAALTDSFHYELICIISKRIPRVYYLGGKKVGTLDHYDCTDIAFNS